MGLSARNSGLAPFARKIHQRGPMRKYDGPIRTRRTAAVGLGLTPSREMKQCVSPSRFLNERAVPILTLRPKGCTSWFVARNRRRAIF
jgi:hypothetical protein